MDTFGKLIAGVVSTMVIGSIYYRQLAETRRPVAAILVLIVVIVVGLLITAVWIKRASPNPSRRNKQNVRDTQTP